MTPRPDSGPDAAEGVLDRNLRLLLTRAWAPVVARESFRIALERDLLAHAVPRRRPRAAPTWTTPLWIAAAAGVALVLSLVLRRGLAGPERLLAPDQILAAGGVALRTGDEGWREIEARPEGAGLLVARPTGVAPPLELATPERAQAVLVLAQTSLRIGPRSHVAIPQESRSQLARGSFEIEAGGEPAFRALTSEGDVELAAGRMALAYVERPPWARPEAGPGPWVQVELLEGAALVVDQPSPRRVEAPQTIHLHAGRIERESGAPSETAADPREAFPAPEAPAIEVDTAEAAPPVVLRGVVRAPGQQPVGSFRILLLEDVRLPDTAEPIVIEVQHPEGLFEVGPQEPGTYTLFVQAAGYATWKLEGLALGLAPPAPDQVESVEVLLDPGLTVRGLVVDSRTAEGVAGAVVLSESDAPMKVLALDRAGLEDGGAVRFVLTGPDGGFELEHVARGSQVLRASDGGLSVGWTERFELAGAAALSGVEIRLPPGGGVEGYVRDESGEPRAGAPLVASCVPFGEQRACLSFKYGQTDEEGYYRIDGLPRGSIAVLLFREVEGGGELTPDMQLALIEPGKLARVDFAPAPQSVRLEGRLLDLGGRPLAGLSLWIAPAGRHSIEMELVSTTTRPDGSFAFEGLHPGPHELFLSGREPGDVTSLERVEITRGAGQHVELRSGAGRIAGHVRAPTSPGGLVPAVLVLNESATGRFAGKVATAGGGSFEFEHVRPGLYDLHAYSLTGGLGQAILERVAVSGSDLVEGLEIELGPGGSALVLVCDEQGQHLEGARVVFRDGAGRKVEFSEAPLSDAGGRYRVAGMSPGPWTVLVELAGYERAAVELEVAVGVETEVSVPLRRAAGGR